MAAAGLAVEAWDLSEGMVRLAAARPGVAARQAGFDALKAHEEYDGIWANFSLLHAPRDAMPGHLAAIARALKPGGLFHVGLKEGSGERRDSLGRLYTYYQEDELAGLLRTAGLQPGSFTRGADKGLDGEVAPWITVTARA
jgi:SAM-dependent methyltransferase